MDYKTVMIFLRVNWLLRHWIVNDISLLNGTTYYTLHIMIRAGFDKSKQLRGFFFSFFPTWKKKGKKREINKKKNRKCFIIIIIIIIIIIVILFLFYVFIYFHSLTFFNFMFLTFRCVSSDIPRSLYTCSAEWLKVERLTQFPFDIKNWCQDI